MCDTEKNIHEIWGESYDGSKRPIKMECNWSNLKMKIEFSPALTHKAHS